MKIFGLYIYTKEELDKICRDKYSEGISLGIETQDKLNRITLNPVVHDLESLRADTWNQDKITKMQQWLESCYDR